jgi:hypothetical protein
VSALTADFLDGTQRHHKLENACVFHFLNFEVGKCWTYPRGGAKLHEYMANLIEDSGKKVNRIEELSKESNESDL